MNEDETCPICQNEIAKIIWLNCGHRFCYNCLVDWEHNGGDKCMMCGGDDSLRKILPKYLFE
jgi:hypothetical protein